MARFKTFTNAPGTALSAYTLPADLNTIQDAYEQAFSTWKTIGAWNSYLSNSASTGPHFPNDDGGAFSPAIATNSLTASLARHIDPADYTVTGRSTQFRYRVSSIISSVAPGNTGTFGLFAASAPTGAAGVIQATYAAAPVASSGLVVATPAANSMTTAVGTPFTLPAGYYAAGMTVSAAIAASSTWAFRIEVQVRQV